MQIRVIVALVAAALVFFIWPKSEMADKMQKVRDAKKKKDEEQPDVVISNPTE